MCTVYVCMYVYMYIHTLYICTYTHPYVYISYMYAYSFASLLPIVSNCKYVSPPPFLLLLMSELAKPEMCREFVGITNILVGN